MKTWRNKTAIPNGYRADKMEFVQPLLEIKVMLYVHPGRISMATDVIEMNYQNWRVVYSAP